MKRAGIKRSERSTRLLQPTLAVLILWGLCAWVSFTGGLPEPWGTRVGQFLSHQGHTTFLVVSLAALLFGPLQKGESRAIRWLCLVGALLGYLLIVEGLKRVIWLPRPGDYVAGTHARGSGFPSGHTVPAFVVACLVAEIYPRWRVLAFAMAVAVGYARVEVRAHFAYQVVASGIFGSVLGVLVLRWRTRKISENLARELARRAST